MTQLSPSSPQTESTIPFWTSISEFLTKPNNVLTNLKDRRRAQLTAALTLFVTISNIVAVLFASDQNLNYLLVISGVGIVSYFISRTRFFSYGAFLFILSLTATPYVTILSAQDSNIIGPIYAWIPLALILASALLNQWALFLLLGISVTAILGLQFIYPQYSSEIATTSGIITTIGILLVYLESFRAGIEKEQLSELTKANQELSLASQFLEERVVERTEQLNRRTEQLEAAAMVARTAAETSNIRILMENVVDEISQRFGFYHTGIFLSDSARQKAYLAAASSEGGKRMLARGHSLDIGREGVVGYAAYEKRPRIAQNIDNENVYFRNAELPGTKSEVALPLIVKNQVIGVLDIQSTERKSFGTDDLFILQTMADQVALAIQNARLLEESQIALGQLQSLSSKSIQDAWRGHLNNKTKGYIYTSGNVEILTDASSDNDSDIRQNLSIVISLRGQKIGTINLKRESEETAWTEKEQEFTEKIASQIALAIENARLLEDSQRRAAREQTLNELTTRLSRSLDVETLLQNAVRELQKLPQVTDATVIIAPQTPRKQESR